MSLEALSTPPSGGRRPLRGVRSTARRRSLASGAACLFALLIALLIAPTPGRAAGTALAGDPFTSDSDGDGVLDALDECPLDPARVVAGTCGCQDRALRVMPVGDSIALGFPVPGGWRRRLWVERTALGGALDLVGTKISNTHPDLGDRQHEGHNGLVIDQLEASLPGWHALVGGSVDVFLVMIGTNDIIQGYDLANAPARMGSLLASIHALEPSAQIVLATLPPFADPTRDADAAAFNAALAEPTACTPINSGTTCWPSCGRGASPRCRAPRASATAAVAAAAHLARAPTRYRSGAAPAARTRRDRAPCCGRSGRLRSVLRRASSWASAERSPARSRCWSRGRPCCRRPQAPARPDAASSAPRSTGCAAWAA